VCGAAVLLLGASTWGGGTECAIVGWLAQRYDRVVAGQQHDRVSGTYSLEREHLLPRQNRRRVARQGGQQGSEWRATVIWFGSAGHDSHSRSTGPLRGLGQQATLSVPSRALDQHHPRTAIEKTIDRGVDLREEMVTPTQR